MLREEAASRCQCPRIEWPETLRKHQVNLVEPRNEVHRADWVAVQGNACGRARARIPSSKKAGWARLRPDPALPPCELTFTLSLCSVAEGQTPSSPAWGGFMRERQKMGWVGQGTFLSPWKGMEVGVGPSGALVHWKEEREEGRRLGRKEGGKEGRREGRREGRKEEGKKDGWTDGWMSGIVTGERR